MAPDREIEELAELARAHGVQTSYEDVMGRQRTASPEALLGVLRALEVPVERPADAREALAARREELADRLAEPVAVAWDGGPPALDLRLSRQDGDRVTCHVDLDGSGRQAWVFDAGALPASGEGLCRLTLPERLPLGIHRLRLQTAGRGAEVVVLSAPTRSYGGDFEGQRLWGVFLPLYALRTARSWGAGDLADLEALAGWTAGLGGGVVATLPLLAAFLDEPCEPSPYAPASRLFWNELYLDPRACPELADSPAARRLIESGELTREIEALRAAREVDYPRLMAVKRRVFEELAHRFFSRASERREDFDRYLAEHPELPLYAAYRAVVDRRGDTWQSWPERLREGTLAPADYDEEDRRYHLWVQWSTAEQVRHMAVEARQRGPGLYLDLPLGVHGGSYDVWRERRLFATAASAGAPPDAFFTRGQDWGFPPLNPERLRESGYAYLAACLRHHLEQAGLLRIDHVMQLHRLFWLPEGMGAADGVYVTYPAEELYALLCLESHRHRAVIVGENLGTVPPEVGEAMDRHNVLGMYVVQYELQPGSGGRLKPPPASSVASLNTHDMPTFRAFWEGRDVGDLEQMGLYDAGQARAERERRRALRREMAALLGREQEAEDPGIYPAVLRHRLEHLAASDARMVLVNLEDLWGETEPQNTPGTHTERPNWRRKARLAFEDFRQKPETVELLARVDELRRGAGEGGDGRGQAGD